MSPSASLPNRKPSSPHLGDAFFCRVDVWIQESPISTIETHAITEVLMRLTVITNPGFTLTDILEFSPEGLGRKSAFRAPRRHELGASCAVLGSPRTSA